MGNDENWIKSLREAGRRYEVAPAPGLWEELEGRLFAAHVARRPAWTFRLRYAAASLMVAAAAAIYLLCGRHNPGEGAPVLTKFSGKTNIEDNTNTLIEEDGEPLLAHKGSVGEEIAKVFSSEVAEPYVSHSEIEEYGEFSYYERVIVVENGSEPMNTDCVLVSAVTDGKATETSRAVKSDHGKGIGIGGRLYASASGAKLSGGFPVSAGATVDIPLSDRLRLETGIEYAGVRVGGTTDSYLGVPVKVSYDIYDRERVRVYASAGGAVEKSLDRRDVGMSLNAGVGIEYSIDDYWGVFVEPGVEYRPSGSGNVPAGPEVRVGFRHTFR